MKKIALVFVVAVLAPSLVLAWLAVRSLRDQQFLLERQQSLLYQGVADTLARQLQDALAGYQAGFKAETAKLLRENAEVARSFDDQLQISAILPKAVGEGSDVRIVNPWEPGYDAL